MSTDTVLLEAYVDVSYTVDDPPHEGKQYPITISGVNFRGKEIDRLLTVEHIMMLQRRMYLKLEDRGEV
jgi:hypothetical protein